MTLFDEGHADCVSGDSAPAMTLYAERRRVFVGGYTHPILVAEADRGENVTEATEQIAICARFDVAFLAPAFEDVWYDASLLQV